MSDFGRVKAESRRRRRAAILGWTAAAGVLAAPLGWFGTDALERDNDFCNACHLTPDVPLHQQIRRDFDHQPVVNLVGAHRLAQLPGREDGEPFRCSDCHGGVGFVGKARTKWLAARDAFWFVVGHFDEPTEMAWPLRDEDCRQCHADFLEAAARAGDANPPFHALGVHNVALAATCVDCHLVHDPGGLEELYHLHPAQVRERCADCHTEFE